MISRSPAFDVAVVNSHQIAVVAEVWSGIGGTNLGTFLPIDGQVDGDVANAVRRTANVVLTDPTGALVPSQASDLLTPFGHELRLYRGITYQNGVVETIPLGVFGMSDIEVEAVRGVLTIRCVGFDRADKISRAQLTSLYTITAGTNVATAIKTLIQSRVPALTDDLFVFSPVTSTLPLTTYQVGQDPWKICLDIAASAGLDLYFDAYGQCVLSPIVDPTTAPIAWRYDTGQASTVLRMNRKLSNREAFNDVVVIGDGVATATTGAILVEVADTNPASPTYINGPYGRNVTVFTSPLITTVQQATFAAQGILARSIGIGESVEFDAIVHPAHEPGDVVQITHLPTKTSATHVLDAVSLPLHHKGKATHRTRRRTA